jgi:hypothetical protein
LEGTVGHDLAIAIAIVIAMEAEIKKVEFECEEWMVIIKKIIAIAWPIETEIDSINNDNDGAKAGAGAGAEAEAKKVNQTQMDPKRGILFEGWCSLERSGVCPSEFVGLAVECGLWTGIHWTSNRGTGRILVEYW